VLFLKKVCKNIGALGMPPFRLPSVFGGTAPSRPPSHYC